jgi:hypothetical protein
VKKIAQNEAQPIFCKKIIGLFLGKNTYPKNLGHFNNIKKTAKNNRPIGEASPNLVTLA